MRYVVTGAAGFIGSHLAQALLLDPGNEVIGIDSLTDYYDEAQKRANLARLDRSNFSFIEADLAVHDCTSLLQTTDTVYHQAGQPGVRKSWGDDFGAYLSANVSATQRLLEAARQSPKLSRFVYASSSSVYGDAERYPTTETDRPTPKSPYGVTKLAAEHLCSLYARNFGLPTVSLRYFTVYGPSQRPDMAFHRFVRAAITGKPVTIYGDGEQVREFTYVADIVRANLAAGQRPVAPGTVINLSGGATVSVNQVLNLLEEIHGGPIRRNYAAGVAGDVQRTGGSTQRAQELLDWTPEVPLSSGLAHEYRWLSEVLKHAR